MVDANLHTSKRRLLAYNSWRAMKSRCSNPRTTQYSDYGGRGICVCQRWLLFDNFLADMGDRPSKQHSIDRIDNDGNYEPGNCRWTTAAEQNQNSRHNLLIKHNGEVRSLKGWAKGACVKYTTFRYRIRQGWPMDKALNTPPDANHDRKSLSSPKVRTIRRLAASGMSQKMIAEQLLIDFRLVHAVVKRKRYRSIS